MEKMKLIAAVHELTNYCRQFDTFCTVDHENSVNVVSVLRITAVNLGFAALNGVLAGPTEFVLQGIIS